MYDPTPINQNGISAVLSFISNTIDPLLFAIALVNNATVSKYKMSVGASSALPPDISDTYGVKMQPCHY